MRKRHWLVLAILAVIIGAALMLRHRSSESASGSGTNPGGGVATAPATSGVEGKAQRASYKALALPAQLPIATGYTVEDAFAFNGGPGQTFSQPLSVVAPPGEKDRLFVVSKAGTIEVLTDLDGKNGGPHKTVFMDLNPYLRGKGWQLGQRVEWGLLGLAFHPDYKNNGYFYVTYNPTFQENGRLAGFDRVSRFSVSKTDPNQADMTSELPLITQFDQAPNHNGGCILFGQDGYLYFSNGDEGNANDSFDNARFIDKDFFAAIFRIDVDRRPENLEPNAHSQESTTFPSAVNMVDGHAAYKVPADNPLVGATDHFGQPVDPAKVRTEMYANGLRNTWRFSQDTATGRIFAAEVGQDRWEEVDLIVKGGNYGWSWMESLHNGPRIASKPAAAKFVDPIYEYDHGAASGEFAGKSISGGFVYRGTRFAELTGAYIFGDYVSRKIWALREKDGKWTPEVLASNVGTPVEITADPRNGDVLISDINNLRPGGSVKRLVRTGVQGDPPPKLLSQVGAFKNLKTLAPADGVIPYEPNVAFWSDYAIKQRWFMVADGSAAIGFDPAGNWNFPAGMVWVKNFEMETTRGDASTRRRLETRFIYKTAGAVYGITYKWLPDGSDAELVGEGGLDEVLDIKVGNETRRQTWHYPSRSECLTCHTQVAGGALGFNTWQLNGAGGGNENQIEKLKSLGYFANGGAIPETKSLGALAKADDVSAPLEWRVRSYLAANCVQCHQPGGVVQGLWDARPTSPLAAAGLIDGTLVSNRGDNQAKVVVPGDAAHSMLIKRVEGNGVPRMPPLATNEQDPAAEKLLGEWIVSLKQ